MRQPNFFLFSFILTALFASSTPAFAYTTRTTTDSVVSSNQNPSDPQGLWLFAGTQLGYLNYDTSTLNGHQGRQLGIEGGVSYFTENKKWVHQALLGFNNSYQNRNDSSFTTFSLSLGANYRFAHRWHAGPTMTNFFGSGNKFESSSNALTTMLGGAIYRDFSWQKQVIRLGAKAMVDMNIPGQTATLYMLQAQMGFGTKKIRVASRRLQRTPNYVAAPEKKEEPTPKLIGIKNINFDSYKTQLNQLDQARLQRLGQVLAKNNDIFRTVRIEGHADFTGPYPLNEKISFKRAESARNALVNAGLDAAMVKIIGKSEVEPLDPNQNEFAKARNRRVEIHFEGVKDKKQLQALLAEFM